MTSLTMRVTNQIFRLTVKSYRGSSAGFVRRFRLLTRISGAGATVPAGVLRAAGTVAGVPGEWLVPHGARGTLLYLHGGAFVSGSPAMYRRFCAALAQRLSLRVFVPDYRLAPEHPFPAASDDACAVYEALVAELSRRDVLVVAGDSAGGNLALGVLQYAELRGLRRATCAVLVSPGLDMTSSGSSMHRNARRDHMLSPHIIDHATKIYMGGGDARDPRASPLFGQLAGLPPLLITVSDSECLRDDALRLAAGVRAAGGVAHLLTRPDAPHVWPVLIHLLPEADEDLRHITSWVAAELATSGDNQADHHEIA